MTITSNDIELVQKLYQELNNNGEEVYLRKKTIAGAYGYEEVIEWVTDNLKIKVDVKMNITEIMVAFINRYFDYKTQKLFLLKEDNKSVPIDTTVIEKGQELENLNVEVEENDILFIEKTKKQSI